MLRVPKTRRIWHLVCLAQCQAMHTTVAMALQPDGKSRLFTPQGCYGKRCYAHQKSRRMGSAPRNNDSGAAHSTAGAGGDHSEEQAGHLCSAGPGVGQAQDSRDAAQQAVLPLPLRLLCHGAAYHPLHCVLSSKCREVQRSDATLCCIGCLPFAPLPGKH